jgi:hypothetical protein
LFRVAFAKEKGMPPPKWLGPVLLIVALGCFMLALHMRNSMQPKHLHLSFLQRLYASGVTLKIMILIAPLLWWVHKVIFG